MASKETVVVRVDVHEPPEVVDAVAHHDEVEDFILTELESGDIVIDNVAFERKTPSDFASSMTDKDDRLRRQAKVMAETYDSSYVLLEGDMQDFDYLTHTRLKPESCRGFAARCTETYDVPVIPCSTTEILVDMAIRLARKHVEEEGSQLRVESSVDLSAPVGLRMWGVIPNVGETRAKALHKSIGSPMDIAHLTREDKVEKLVEIDGIGEGTAEQIIKHLTTKQVTKV